MLNSSRPHPLPNYKPGLPTHLQKSLTDSTSAFFDLVKYRYQVAVALDHAFPKDAAESQPLADKAYTWAVHRAAKPRQFVQQFLNMVRVRSLSVHRVDECSYMPPYRRSAGP